MRQRCITWRDKNLALGRLNWACYKLPPFYAEFSPGVNAAAREASLRSVPILDSTHETLGHHLPGIGWHWLLHVPEPL